MEQQKYNALCEKYFNDNFQTSDKTLTYPLITEADGESTCKLCGAKHKGNVSKCTNIIKGWVKYYFKQYEEIHNGGATITEEEKGRWYFKDDVKREWLFKFIPSHYYKEKTFSQSQVILAPENLEDIRVILGRVTFRELYDYYKDNYNSLPYDLNGYNGDLCNAIHDYSYDKQWANGLSKLERLLNHYQNKRLEQAVLSKQPRHITSFEIWKEEEFECSLASGSRLEWDKIYNYNGEKKKIVNLENFEKIIQACKNTISKEAPNVFQDVAITDTSQLAVVTESYGVQLDTYAQYHNNLPYIFLEWSSFLNNETYESFSKAVIMNGILQHDMMLSQLTGAVNFLMKVAVKDINVIR